MILTKPYKSANRGDVSQVFMNKSNAYASGYHDGTDWCSSYGTFLVAPEDVLIERLYYGEFLDQSTEGLRRGHGLVMKSLETPNVYHLYWHCLPIFPVKVGDVVNRGKVVGQMGNTGYVMRGGVVVPLELRNIPPYQGTHLHQGGYEMVNGEKVFFDTLAVTDFSLPVNYDVITTMKSILQNMSNVLKGQKK